MKVGIDSYSFHRYFGEVYPGLQRDPGIRWKMEDQFLEFARQHKAEEVALETIFFPVMDRGYCAELKSRLDELGLDRVIAWGHPDGLHAGSDQGALEDLKRHIPQVPLLGAGKMRICASSMLYVDGPKETQIPNVIRMLKEAVQVAREHGVVLAVENHIDFTSDEILRILEGVDSDHLRVNFDTGNALRLFEDPVQAARKLGRYTIATHTKDISPRPKGGTPMERFTWWPSCPVGQGVIDMAGVISALAEEGFDGGLDVEIDLLGPQWENRTEEEIVAESLGYLRQVLGR